MDILSCQQVAGLLGSRFLHSGNNIMISCPNAPYTNLHKNSLDKSPSFGIKISFFPEPSLVHCFTCGLSGTAKSTFYLLYQQGVVDKTVFEFVKEADQYSLKSLSMVLGNHKKESVQEKPVFDIDSLVRRSESNRIADRHLHRRGVTDGEISAYRLGYDSYRKRITFPSISTRIAGCVGRALDGVHPKYYKYTANDDSVLFGEHLLDYGCSSIVLVEGPMDAISVHRVFPNVLSLNGINLTERQCERMLYFADNVILMLDGDKAGINAAIKIGGNLSRRTNVYVVLIRNNQDPSDLSISEIKKYLKNKQKY